MFKSVTLITATSLALMNSYSVKAENDTTVRVGGFYANSDSNIDVNDPLLGNNFSLDFEQDLKLSDSRFLPFFEFVYQFDDRHNFYADWKQLHRSANTQSVEKPFQFTWDETTYNVNYGISLDTTLNIDIARIGYGYDVWQGDKYEVGFSIGLHVMFIETAFKGNIGICEDNIEAQCPDSVTIPKIVDDKVTAPLPDLGVYGSYQINSKLTFSGHAQYFYVKLDNLKGALFDVRLGIEAAITDNWHMSAAFNYYEVDVEYTSTIKNSDMKIADYNMYYSFTGPMLSVSYQF
ncbi:DUF481 domain-containing protein [Shewanella youngdeokensis]|uniref:DUF481 domain-containing protein n=1 Tax=Shewanella youngdeokensis TaxID=2999068 RepID=A0ABZ0K1X6_9GAMM|nr:DUF481 domain-containing protein [Shewanella sp. DAU334]